MWTPTMQSSIPFLADPAKYGPPPTRGKGEVDYRRPQTLSVASPVRPPGNLPPLREVGTPGSPPRSPTSPNRGQSTGLSNSFSMGRPLTATMSQTGDSEGYTWDPRLTYGEPKTAPPPKVPDHVKYDKKVLAFDAYFKEYIDESDPSEYRVRRCRVNFFLEDKTILVNEPRQENSGMPQGVLIKRQRIPKEDPVKHKIPRKKPLEYFDWTDLNVGVEVTFFGRKFRLVNCDGHTRDWLTANKIAVGPPEEVPADPYEETRKRVERSPERTYGRKASAQQEESRAKLRRFLSHDKQVLRFFCYWDDRQSLYGERRPFVLHYFLVDDTVCILEVLQSNSGRDPFPVFLKRQRLPKHGGAAGEYVGPVDLRVGSSLVVFGRPFTLYDADEFTRRYYKDQLGIELAPPSEPVDNASLTTTTEPSAQPPKPEVPPYQGFGSEEDSLASCLALLPKPPKKNFRKLMENDKKILRFSATFAPGSTRPEHANRRFVVSYYLADDTISIYEPAQRNSGVVGGKFLERRRIKKPNSDEYYKASDFFVGATIEIFKYQFVLHDADEFAYKHMEANANEFPMSDLFTIEMRLKEYIQEHGLALRDVFDEIDKDKNGFVSSEEFKKAVQDLQLPLTEHELKTIVRRYDLDSDGKISYDEFVAALSC